jgi:TP901 family phage tail tape measure protein
MAKILLNVKLDLGTAKKDLEQLETSINKIANSLNKVQVNKDLTKQLNALAKTWNAAARQTNSETKAIKENIKAKEQLERTANKVNTAFKNTNTTTKDTTQSIVSMAEGFLDWQVAAKIVMTSINLIRGLFNSLNETLINTEKRVIELRRVVGASANADELYELAETYGQTFENVSDIALNFARSGMDWSETIKATEAAVLALNVAELDATEASDGLIAVMQQFNLDASDLTLVIDKLNITADNAAVTTEKLLAALQRTGSSATNANLSLDETVGLITALSEATGRSGENIGTALNSLIQFSKKDSALNVFASLGGDTATVVEKYKMGAASILDVWQELSKNIESLSESQALIENADFETLEEELKTALGEDFATIQEVYGTASTYRQNYFIALLNNMEQVEESINTMQEAAGYSAKENEEYLDTYEAKLNSLQAKWQYLANDEQGFLAFKKLLVDSGIAALELLESVGGLRTAIFALGTAIAVAFAPKVIKAVTDFGAALAGGLQSAQAVAGWIGLAITAISIIVGVVEKINQTERERQQAQEDAYQSNKEYASSLRELYNEYENLQSIENKTKEQETQEIEVKKSLIEKLKEQHKLLGDINDELIRQLVLSDLAKDRAGLDAHLEYVEDNIKWAAQQRINARGITYQDDTEDFNNKLVEYLTEAGLNVSGSYKDDISKAYIRLNDLPTGYSTEENLARYAILNEYKAAIEKKATELFEAGDIESSTELYNSEFYKEIESAIKTFGNTTDDWIQSKVKAYYIDNLDSLENLEDDEFKDVIQNYITELGLHSFYNDTIWEAFADVLGKDIEGLKETSDEAEETTKKWANDLSKVTDKYKSIIEQLKKIRDVNKESLDYEEKKKAVLEAEQALLDAQNERNVRIFNEKTGQWEWQANEKDIATAQEKLEEARKEVEEEAYNAVITELENGNTTNEKILEIIALWAEAYGTGDFSSIASNISSIIQNHSGVDINAPTYDSGGILTGLGGIKATPENEMVLPPELTAKFLEPTSNAQFKAFADSLGLLFGASTQIASMNGKVISNYAGATNHYNNGRYYTINGMQIPSEVADRYTLAELFETMAFLKD